MSGLDRLLVISWLVLSSQIWVFHFSPQKSAPESQLLANTDCWYAGVMSQTDKTPQAASTACLVLAKSADPDPVHLGLMALLASDLGLVSNFRVSSDWIS